MTMEKYGVNTQDDEFEKEAQKMVKTGSVKKIQDAREIVTDKNDEEETK